MAAAWKESGGREKLRDPDTPQNSDLSWSPTRSRARLAVGIDSLTVSTQWGLTHCDHQYSSLPRRLGALG